MFSFQKKEGCWVAEGCTVAKTVNDCISILLPEVQCCWVPTYLGKNLHFFLALQQIRQSRDTVWPLRSKQNSQGEVYSKVLYRSFSWHVTFCSSSTGALGGTFDCKHILRMAEQDSEAWSLHVILEMPFSSGSLTS